MNPIFHLLPTATTSAIPMGPTNSGAPVQANVPAPTAPAASAQQPSWWEKLLPAAGGVLGGILGIPGDLFSGGVSSVAGAAGGGAIGQAIENKLTGKSAIQANDLTSGVENGVGDLVGLGAGKVVAGLGGGLSKVGTDAAAKVTEENATDAASKEALDNAAATKLNYGGISNKVQSMLDLGKNQKFVTDMGFDATNPYEMQKVGQGASELNNVYDHALQQAPDVNMGDFNKSVLESMRASGAKDLTSTNSPVGQAISDFTKKSGLDITPQMKATDVRQLQQAVGRQIGNQENIISNAELNGQYNAEAHSQVQTLQDLYGQLGDKIKTPEVDNAIKSFQVTDADRQGLVAKYGDKLGNQVADTIGNAKSADDLLGPMQQFTKMNKASQMAIDDIENVTASPRAEARTKFVTNGGVATPTKINGDPTILDAIEGASKATGHPASTVVSVANKLHKAGVTPKIAEGMGTVLGKTAPLIAPTTTALANAPNVAAQSNSAIPSNVGAMAPTGQPGEAPMTPQAPAAANPYGTIIPALEAQDILAPSVYGSSAGSTLSSILPAYQKQQLAGDVVGNLAPTFANAGGAQGTGGGFLNSLIGKLVPGSAQSTYLNEQQAAAAQLAAVLGIPLQQAMALVPSMMSNQGVAGQQQAGLSSVLNTLTPSMVGAQPAPAQ